MTELVCMVCGQSTEVAFINYLCINCEGQVDAIREDLKREFKQLMGRETDERVDR